jgi:hypothetical protein
MALTPTFWAALTITHFDSLDPPQSKTILNDDVPAEVSVLSEQYTNTSTQFKLAGPPHVEHEHYFFDDGNITFLVRPLRRDTGIY